MSKYKYPWWLSVLTGDPFTVGLSYLFGGKSKNGTNETDTSRAPGDQYTPDANGVQGPNWFRSLINKYTGAGLTGAENEQNQFNAEQALLDWERSEVSADNALNRQRELRQTAFQDTVADASAAGINPYFAVSGSATGVSSAPQGSSHAASGSAPASGAPSLDTLLNLVFAGQRFKLTKAEIKTQQEQARNIAADTAKKEAETEGQRISNAWIDRLSAAQEASQQAAAKLDRERVQEVYANIRRAESEVTRNLELAKSETERRELMGAQAVLARANAWNITALTPYMQAELEARAENERALAQEAVVAAAFQQGLIDSGMIEAQVRRENANASDAEVRAEVGKVEQRLKQYDDDINHGNISRVADQSDSVVGGLFSVVKIAVDTVKP